MTNKPPRIINADQIHIPEDRIIVTLKKAELLKLIMDCDIFAVNGYLYWLDTNGGLILVGV